MVQKVKGLNKGGGGQHTPPTDIKTIVPLVDSPTIDPRITKAIREYVEKNLEAKTEEMETLKRELKDAKRKLKYAQTEIKRLKQRLKSRRTSGTDTDTLVRRSAVRWNL